MNLHLKLVLILVLLMVSIMAVVGTFLVNSVATYYLDDFSKTLSNEFSQNTDLVSSLRSAADESNAAEALYGVMNIYAGTLGIDLYTRNFYILDGTTGGYIRGSDPEKGRALDLTPNILAALGGEPAYSRSMTADYIDAAVPFDGEGGRFIVYVRDSKTRATELTTELFVLILEALLFGLVVSVLLSFHLTKTITTPIEGLTTSARAMADGKFSERIEVRSGDEIGLLTETFNDMAERLQQTLETVRSERDKLETLFLRMTDGVCSFDRGGKVVSLNPAACRMLGEAGEASDYAEMFENILPFGEALRLRPPSYFETDVVRGDLILKVFITPFGETESGLMAVIHDITEQTKLDMARREFVANVSHELRTPLTNIKSYTETLLENEDIDSKTRKNFLSVVGNEADRMTHIVSDLLILSRFDHGGLELNIRPTPIRPMIERVRKSMSLEAAKRSLEMTVGYGKIPDEVDCDPERIEQVLVNIISNAIKYTPDGGKISVYCDTEPGCLCVSVADNGVGIPSEALSRLFERFYRVDKARSRAAGGSGLGLAIAKEIVDRHKGDIEIRSIYGKGTTVCLRLPL